MTGPRVTRPSWALAVATAAVVLVGLTAPAAHAVGTGTGPVLRSEASSGNDPEDRVTEYVMDVVLDDDGVATVTLDLTVDFGRDANHGPYLTYLVKERWDDELDRIYRFSDVRAQSPTASAQVDTEEEGRVLVVRIGDEDRTITGEHTYRVTYRVEGWVDGTDERAGVDRVALDVFGGWEIPVLGTTVRVTAPADVSEVVCAAGPAGSAEPCTTASAEGTTATFTQDRVEPGENLTVGMELPVGTFGGAGPILQDRWSFARAFAVTPWTVLVTVLVGALMLARVLTRIRRTGRDEQFAGLTPGLAPVVGQESQVVPRSGRQPVAVQFTPPVGLRPGELGTLIDERADPHDVTATVIDLAVRGFIRIVEVEAPDRKGKGGDWRLERIRKPRKELLAYEYALVTALFAGRETVLLSELRTTFSQAMSKVQDELYAEVTSKGWFRTNPKHARTVWGLGATGVILVGVLLTVALAIWTSWALVGLAVLVVGIVAACLTGRAPARTATGTAVLVQTEGFKHYLETAEADQLRFEEGEDVFSRYLPFAVAFGLTERWARLFADLAAQGRPTPEPDWYTGTSAAGLGLWATGSGFSQSLTSFADMADSALTAPAPSSDSSSSGGGFSGGGAGGGGGGTW